MTRPNADIPEHIHGGMKEVGKLYGLTDEEVYTLAAKLLVRSEPDVDYDPDDDETRRWLRKAARRADELE